ncbi:RimJ/RimL family protein N-acetyltransferase [Lentzea atacamensis]|uniref:RimJ/RimL family protein N-acetyltransferase n=1 Tax=Lentzea atacamensis TaxID=531938 RepID=A0ABX9EGW9_9PSEU|nr:GNAT family N-acetyltransferase [Lentzea atacamensis]RAS70430.1 RimJ/RimL family protein N-acetyltransferase [Lentzea atacamensis]
MRLREWTVDDAAWYAEATRDPEVQRYTTDPPTITAAQVAAAIEGLRTNPATASFCVEDAGERCGNVAVDLADGVGHVSYLIAAQARGRGLATRALAEFVAWIFANHPVDELRLWTHRDNTGSRKVAERAGFVRDPARDDDREVKGTNWPTVAYRLCR